MVPRKKLTYFLSFIFLSACSVGPDYKRPDLQYRDQWDSQIVENMSIQKCEIEWWKNFEDNTLTSLIQKGFKANNDIKIAEHKILEARAAYREAFSNLFPQFDWSGSVTRNERSLNGPQGSMGGKRVYNLFKSQVDLNWEIDLFGRLNRAKEAAQASLASVIADAQAVFITLASDIAQNYISLRRAQKELEITQKNLEDWKRIYSLNWDRFKSGIGTELSMLQAKASMEEAESKIFPLKAKSQIHLHLLGILVGEEPGFLSQSIEKHQEIPVVSSKIFIGLPSELLQRRSDLRKAEQDLIVTNAKVGIAIGELFPKFSLTGFIGHESTQFPKFFESKSRYFQIGPGFTFVLFDFGRIRARIEQAKAIYGQTYYTYKKLFLVALKEVEDGLVNYFMDEQRRSSLQKAVFSSEKAHQSAMERYKGGLTNFLDVLNTKLTLYTNQIHELDAHESLSINTILLYKALGGGWEKDALYATLF